MFECLKEALPYRDFILKKELELYTGGVITQYTFKNSLDFPKPIIIGNKTAYKIEDIIAWLEKNVVEEKNLNKPSEL